MPRPVEALPCGSKSMMRTRLPTAARAVARLTVVVVLPTPPFWLATEMTRARDILASGATVGNWGTSGTGNPAQAQDSGIGVRDTLYPIDSHIPSSGGGGQFVLRHLTLGEQTKAVRTEKWSGKAEKITQRGE